MLNQKQNDSSQLYLVTLEITRGINEEENTEVFNLGIFDNLEQAKIVAQIEFNKNMIPDEHMQNVQRIWDKYKEECVPRFYKIPEANEKLLYAELNESNLKEIFDDERCLMGSETRVQIYAYQLNIAHTQQGADAIFNLIHRNAKIRYWG